jgi:hypothetical protein
MPTILDDISLDTAPDEKLAKQALNSRALNNTTIDRVEDEIKEEQQDTRKDDDGGHRRDDEGKPANNPDSVFYQGRREEESEEESSDDTNIGNFVKDLFGDTKDDDEEQDVQGGQTGNTNDDAPKTDEELDSEEEEDDTPSTSTSGSDRSGQFGAGTTGNDGPTFIAEGRNRSKGLHIEYKGVKYTIDRKGTTDELDAGSQAWQDDTVTVGTTVISLKDYFEKSDEERKKMFSDALGDSSSGVPTTPPVTKKFTVKSIFWVLKRDSKYGAIVEVGFDNNGTKTNATFDDTGHIEILGVKYSAKEVFIDGDGSYVVNWLKKQVDDTKSEELAALYAGWGFTPDNLPADTPKDENATTNPDDPEKKFEPKAKENEAPKGAPQNVENSAALTTSKLRALEGQTVKPGASINMWDSFIDYKVPKFASSTGFFGIRDQKASTLGLGKPENEYKTESKLIGAVKSYFNSNWSNLITGTPVPVAKQADELKIIDYPIIMNFTEVGVWNKKVPYVADTQTEQHRMLYISYSNAHNMGKWGIGSYDAKNGGFANWAEQPHWCGIFTQHCISHGGYTFPGQRVALAGANNINNVYLQSSLVSLKEKGMDAEQSLGNIPTYIDSSGQEKPHLDLLKLKAFGNGSGANYKTPIYSMLIDTAMYQESSESEVVMVPEEGGKKLKPKKKTTMKRERIPIAVRESFLPNPIMVYFIAGIHFTNDGLTPQGKKLIEHLLSQRDWEVAIISRGGHIEVCPYINPDGTIARFGGNTGNSNVVSRDGGKFAAKASSIWAFSSGAKAGSYVCFTKVVPKGGSQKIDPTLNGQFRRTPIVDSYYRSINGKTILPTLKNVLYDTIVEKE